MKTLWKRIETWLYENSPDGAISLPGGASEADLRHAESIIGLNLPKDLREPYKIHNGSNRLSIVHGKIIVGYLMPIVKPGDLPRRRRALLSEVVGTWESMKGMAEEGYFKGMKSNPNGPIRADWWNGKSLSQNHRRS